LLGLWRELADRHVFDHAPPQRAHCLVGYGDAPVLSEGCQPLISRQDAPSRYPVVQQRGRGHGRGTPGLDYVADHKIDARV
jgi:hypothetical protein